MKNIFLKIWRWIRWPLLVLVGLILIFTALVIWRAEILIGEEETKADVERIHANKLTWSDINGELPPEPDSAENNETLAGVDVNTNGIRDDVERAIYLKYKSSPRTVIPMLQYAKELQMEFTEVYNSETLVAVMEEESRGYSCVDTDKQRDEVKNFVFNTDLRKNERENIYRKYMTSWGIPNVEACDISL